MTFKTFKLALLGLALTATSAVAAPIVTFQESTAIRTQVQGGGTYKVLDLFYSNSVGAEFLAYQITAEATTGSLFDPARLQDDRQVMPQTGAADGNTLGHVDTWANTVMTAAGKEDAGATGSITADPTFYVPTGTGAAPAFTKLDWAVTDSAQGDDNDLSDHPDTPLPAAAPYHLVRILASENAAGTLRFATADSLDPGTETAFQFNFGAVVNTPPTVTSDAGPNQAGQIQTTNGQVITHDFDATDVEDPAGPFTWAVTMAPGSPIFDLPGGTDSSSPASIDSNGTFSWNTLGAGRGVYNYLITATDPDGAPSAPATPYSVTITAVPEPSTLALFGLAMVGGLGLVRRRNG